MLRPMSEPTNDLANDPATGSADGPTDGPSGGRGNSRAEGPASGPRNGPGNGPGDGPVTGPATRLADGPANGSADGPARLAVVVGSVREGRFGPTVASWLAAEASAHGGFDVEVVDLADADLPLALPAASPMYAGDGYPRPAGMAALTVSLEAADAFVIVTPEYNHSYPASLKAAIDWHFTQWTAKPVAFVSYGERPAGATPSSTWRTSSPSSTP
jgi:NAD(P)H-dependent FMN reductase